MPDTTPQDNNYLNIGGVKSRTTKRF